MHNSDFDAREKSMNSTLSDAERKRISKAMSLIASIKSPKRAAAARENGRLGGRPRKATPRRENTE
jgi:hypothetical protein